MRVNSLLRQMVQATLSERKLQPVATVHLIEKINSELIKMIQQPDAWKEVLHRTYSIVGNDDPDVIEDLAQDELSNVGGSAVHTGRYVIVQVKLKPLSRNTKKLAKKIDTMVRNITKRYGWLVLAARHDTGWKDELIIQLERNYGDRLQAADIPTFLFHTTRVWDVEKILRKGLLPKKASHKSRKEEDYDELNDGEDRLEAGRQYPPRVYLTASKPLANELVMSFQPDAYGEAMMTGSTADMEPYILLRVDTRKLMRGAKFYVDNEFDNSRYQGLSYWTYTRIPAAAISVDRQDKQEYQEFLDYTSKDDF
jgi:hypothetical protein